MKLIEALSILSKSSPFAVSTERTDKTILQSYKDYLYIETEVEVAFKQKLLALKNNEIIFLCGSSGDGKSEILTRYKEAHKLRVDFHLDATHSFTPNQTAIEALDECFSQFKEIGKPLVVGINVGMLGNYAEEGAELHNDIKASMKAFMSNKVDDIAHKYKFIDFEQYPKFKFTESGQEVKFAEDFLSRLTLQTLDNPFYALYDNEIKKLGHCTLTTNYALLSLDSVKNNIIILLLKARLIKDQFLTARTLLDFVFQILAMDNYLFDNLFSGADNEFLENIQCFDPSNIHTRKTDEFFLQFGLGIEDEEFTQLKEQVKPFGVFNLSNAASYLRMIYLLKDEEQFENDYINKLKVDFDNSLVDKYANIWLLHRDFDGSGKQKNELNKFYKNILIAAIHRYCNRNSPTLDKDQFFISEYNGFKTAVGLEMKSNFASILTQGLTKIGSFNAYIKVDDHSLLPMSISINLLELLEKINQGYRPNKHDKNAVLLLDEVIEQIVTVANEKNTLFILKSDKRYKVINEDDEYFEVSGI
ncbi:DNA phosphorothioation-dependent restriction protein DptF [Photobacterium kishitanii]|uniref:DNA phosphorothioation-dependent restriction protein DptF n=1 Tax=Photobacterium kishitanii TaxID=318456 RepID=UPI00043549E3|nr:DNA phosphorothioation-dependent restriction protein DptF [Photobacterium kishitanii]CEO42014.1 DNA phosphorothioation-dependent restriction protein DptF [Photobacterium kishitanii]